MEMAMSIGTLVAAIIAAIAAIWAAYVSHKQLRLTTNPARPLATATFAAIAGQMEWSEIVLEIRNRAAIPVEILSVAVSVPRGVKILTEGKATGGLDRHGDPIRLDPLPVELASETDEPSLLLREYGRAGDAVALRYLAHRPLHHFESQLGPYVSLKMRWRDHAVTTFAMRVAITRAKTI